MFEGRYLSLKLATDATLATFILTVVLVSVDFWVTKNIGGKKLVGLRWWSVMADNGEEEWIF
jgi:hypothetical protein